MVTPARRKATLQPRRRRRQKYSTAPLAPDNDASASYGPAMRALSPMQRRFVLELQHGPAGYGSEIRALKAAGYGKPNSTENTLYVMANHVLHNPESAGCLARAWR
jgi:hypothetical protein